jgi:hypothetical protein
MRRLSVLIGIAALALVCASPGPAQIISPGVPGGSQFIPPMPPPPPPPKIEVPVVPQIDALPQQHQAPARRPSFGDRISKCLDEAAAIGLAPSERSAYSRTCANQ